MNYKIRKINSDEIVVLNDFLYEAIFIPEGIQPPSKDIILQSELQVYVKEFGMYKGDIAFVAEIEGKIVGAVWTRIMNDYGHIDDNIPSFAISLYKEYRRYGIGTEMMRTALLELKEQGFLKASLAVQKENYAVKMYKTVGFKIIDENDEEFIMLCNL
jgi:ribosomal protein S18 acetylase RimI-like enzyme